MTLFGHTFGFHAVRWNNSRMLRLAINSWRPGWGLLTAAN